MNSIKEIANEINRAGKYVATVAADGVMSIQTPYKLHICDKCKGAGTLNEAAQVVVERVLFDPETNRVLAGNGAAMASGDAANWMQSFL